MKHLFNKNHQKPTKAIFNGYILDAQTQRLPMLFDQVELFKNRLLYIQKSIIAFFLINPWSWYHKTLQIVFSKPMS